MKKQSMFQKQSLTSWGDSDAETLLSQSLESFQLQKVGRNLVVLSVRDSLPVGSSHDSLEIPSDVDVAYLYIENLVLAEPLRLKKGVVACYSLRPGGSNPVIDISGKPGLDPNGSPDKAPKGGRGHSAGDLTVYIEEPSLAPPNFRILAAGGAGGPGRNAGANKPAGNGGNGGNGGHVVVFGALICLRWLSQLQSINHMTRLTAKRSALKRVWTELRNWREAPKSLLGTFEDALNATSDDAFNKALQAAALQLAAMKDSYAATMRPRVDITGGNYGVYGRGAEKPLNGKPGKDGTSVVVPFGRSQELAASGNPAAIMVHPSQCERLLNKIKLSYFVLDPAGNPASVRDLMKMLLRLKARTDLFAALGKNTPLAKFYADNEAAVGAIGSVSRLASINAQAGNLLDQLRQGCDVFGYHADYVPLASFKFYDEQTKEMAANFARIEKNYRKYFQSLQKNKRARTAIETARDQQSAIKKVALDQLRSLKDRAEFCASVIDSYKGILPGLKKTVEDEIARFKARIAQFTDFNIENLFQALQMLAFVPKSSFMWVLQVGQFAYESQTKVANIEGFPVRKDYMVSQLKAISLDVDGLTDGCSALDDGTLQPDEAGAGKLIAEEEKASEFFNAFYDKFPEEIDAFKQAFDNYIQQVVARNTEILRYNALVTLMHRAHQAISDAEDRLEHLDNKALRKMKPYLPDLVTFVSSIYYNARSQIMELLDLTSRAFRFWALTDENIIDTAYDGRTPPNIDATALDGVRNTILTSLRQAIEQFGTGSTPFPKVASRPGLLHELEDYQVELFRQTGSVMVKLPPARRDTSLDENVFADMANVRISVARVWVYGATTRDGILRVRITHTGKEEMVSSSDDLYSFRHDPVAKTFKYRLNGLDAKRDYESSSIEMDANFGVTGWLGRGSHSEYAALGPFTTWQISINEKDNPGLDMSKITRVVLEFQGTAYAFH